MSVLLAACGGSKTPTAPAVTATGVQISAAGNVQGPLAPGDTRQLVATAARTDGSTLDVSNQAVWQSSAPSIATVSASGMVTAVAEGDADISATYTSLRGTFRAEVRPTCAVVATPPGASFNAFGGSATVSVSVNSASCRWTAKSDASWFPFLFEPAAPGSGSFTYAIPPNSTPSARTATVTIETSTAQTASYAITEDRPVSRSYVADPAEIVFSAAGGTGQFNVITTPGDCQWNLVNGMSALGVSITSGFSGTGKVLVRYTVQAHTRTVDADGYIEIAGLSGANPNGRHHIVILKR